jgi:hypothetical protein
MRGRSRHNTQSQSRWAAQIAKTPDPTDQFVGTPSFVIGSDGTYWASHNWFGSGTGENTTVVYKSEDKGGSWSQVVSITGVYWATLFHYGSNQYLLGVDGKYGNLVLYYSSNDWSTSSSITVSSGNYHKGSTAYLEKDGYLFFAVEDAKTGSPTWPQFDAQVWFVDVTDIANVSSWYSSNALAYNTSWGSGSWSQEGWLEGNVCETTGGDIVLIYRHNNEVEHKGCYLTSTWASGTQSLTLAFDDSTGFVDLLGGAVQVQPVWHTGASKWLILSNHRTATRTADPAEQRDELWLCSSSDLQTWTTVKQLHGDAAERSLGEGVDLNGFQYCSAVLSADENTLHYVSRTSWHGADTEHNANRLTYDFVPDLNALLGV